jgi:uncharacterized membrane protein HdeD (DUF308 family)
MLRLIVSVMILATESTPMVNAAADEGSVSYQGHIPTPSEISGSWRFILITGIVNIIAGVLCLSAQLVASKQIQETLVSLLALLGIFNIATMFHERQDVQQQLVWVGVAELMMALLLYLYPFGALRMMTLVIAFSFLVYGSLEISIAPQNSRIAARSMTYASGVLTLLLSILVMLTMPLAEWRTISALLGANLLNIGFCRLIVAFYGRSLS